MAVCEFVEELSKLKKSSKDSVDSTNKFDEFKQYMHIPRNIEEDLKEILRHINGNDSKSLVLLCGSAGDGKSHLLSYLYHNDSERLLDNFTIFNDGTESFAPNKSAIDTLNELLNEYSDESLSNNKIPSKSIILAINLGVLNNFIDSEYGERYKLLKKYVQKKGILTSTTNSQIISDNKYFQSLSFSDYQLFMLKNDGIKNSFVLSLMEKIFGESESNPFNSIYKNCCCKKCVKSTFCSVKHNYEFMKLQSSQNFVAEMLAECIIKYKLILTIRECQDFLYDIIVPKNFDPILLDSSNRQNKRITAYLDAMTPSLMFEQKETSVLLDAMNKLDPVLTRNEKNDMEEVDFYVTTDIEKDINLKFHNLPYKNFLLEEQLINELRSAKKYRAHLFSIIKRCDSFISEEIVDKNYLDFLKYLYYYNVRDIKKLDDLYEKIEKAVKQWCGTDEDDNLCIESNELGYKLYEEVKFEVYDDLSQKNNQELLYKFSNCINVSFEAKDEFEPPISLVIDYNLYDLICKLNNGYVQTYEDCNNHADFLAFIEKIKHIGSADRKVIIKGTNGIEVVFQKKKLGFVYKNKG